LRLQLFAKGNTALRDPLHMQVVGGTVLWNGINQVLREAGSPDTIRVRHETLTCFAALNAASGAVPADLREGVAAEFADLFGPFPLRAQFSTEIFSPGHTAIVLSLEGDTSVKMLRHREHGYLLHAYAAHTSPDGVRHWLRENFSPEPATTAHESMAQLAVLVARIRAVADIPILVFNQSAIVPGDSIHCYQGVGETWSRRVRRFNDALMDASAELGFSIVDVDRLVAEQGARHVMASPIHLNPLGCRIVAEEVVRILADHGVLTEAGA
jgi:hypothetical protein